ncbi:tRNA wybutosine-synthesizing protein 2 homolog isoform X2 [Artemia franciscana]|uniref:tRNA wybutosine-synthesizing protein 2 homolog isoform X2 n=1 Tax=Artemia franciscana TaxID=6661 RepID=UPI0032DA15D7
MEADEFKLLTYEEGGNMNPHLQLKEKISHYLSLKHCSNKEQLLKEIPKKWEKYGDTVLFKENSFIDSQWKDLFEDEVIFQTICKCLQVKRIAKRGRIENDDFRSPKIKLLYGDSPWVSHKDNNVRLTWNIEHSMFSAGNISEKIRLSKLDCRSEVIVDLYAGIGYFSLQYLVNAKAKFVHACEWNPYAVEALKRNLVLNGVADRCEIHFGDNKMVCPQNVGNRVNLGLIPSSEPGWRVACRALRQDIGGTLHIHGNVNSNVVKPGQLSPHKLPRSVKLDNKTDEDVRNIDVSRSELSNHGHFVSSVDEGIVLEPKTRKLISSNTIKSEDNLSASQLNCIDVTEQNHLNNRTTEFPDETLSSPLIMPASGYSLKSQQMVCESESNDLENSVTYRCKEWEHWAAYVKSEIKKMLEDGGKNWNVRITHLEDVKSYAPRINHLVLDLLCTPVN